MRLKTKHCFLFGILFLTSLPTVAQDGDVTQAKLITRYERGAAVNRLNEDVLTLTLATGSNDRVKIGLRVCSKEPMAFALVTASADPLLIAERLIERYAYLPDRIIYLRSEDCLSSHNFADPVTEVWVIKEGAALPSHVEAASGSQVKRTSLGKIQLNRGVRDYKAALQDLIRDLRSRPTAIGIVFGYFLDRPSKVLQQRLREVTRTLQRSGLPPNRYLVRPMTWNDEVSTYPPDKEPSYPSVFLVEMNNAKLGSGLRFCDSQPAERFSSVIRAINLSHLHRSSQHS